MLTRTRLEELPLLGQPLHLALGVFDGVHLGHQEVLKRVLAAAKREGGLAGMVTFHPHPCRAVRPEQAPPAILACLEHKEQILREMGMDLFIPMPFDEELSLMKAEDFLKALTVGEVRTLAVGEDWRFGRDRAGCVQMLQERSGELGYRLEAVKEVMAEGLRISSTRIREAIGQGHLEKVRSLLGRPYSLMGRVEHGDQLGRQLGFPTANVATGDAQLPPHGVWSVWLHLQDGRRIQGVANLGLRPTVDGREKRLEAHLFEFDEDLYGKLVEVEFHRYLREERKFESLDALKAQLASDEREARASFF